MNNILPEDKANQIKKAILNAENISILMHNNPDGDALGSTQGFYLLLKKLGKNVSVISPNAYPEFLAWMKDHERIIIGNKNKKNCLQQLKETDFLIMMDFNVLSRLDWLEPVVRKMDCPSLLIDHHPEPCNDATYTISDISVSSTAELTIECIEIFGWADLIDRDTGECFYAGIMTDTGCFSYNSSLPRTFEIVASLLNTGIRKDMVYANVYNNYSYSRMKLLGLALKDNLYHIPEYHTAYIVLTQEEQNQYHFHPGDTEGFVNYPLSIKGTRFSALFLEKQNHIKISFRSIGDFPANEFAARYFNGGGHLNAAGGETNLDIQESIDLFVDKLAEYAEKLK
ncbi:MAG: DHH family phosphoesterase [Bacteroidales bacterium]